MAHNMIDKGELPMIAPMICTNNPGDVKVLLEVAQLHNIEITRELYDSIVERVYAAEKPVTVTEEISTKKTEQVPKVANGYAV